jgi:hypothetical protein
MIELRNEELSVALLDPVADHARLGPRYVWGGYIWQAFDLEGRALLSGPEWPNQAPTPFNGQGLPESFRHRSLDGRDFTWRGDRGCGIGIGALERSAPAAPARVDRPCAWTLATGPGVVEFTTRDDAADFPYALTRTLTLDGRILRSTTHLTNASPFAPLALEWFAHPFFPLVDGHARARLPSGSALPVNRGFAIEDDTLIQRRRFVGPDDGHMERGLTLPRGERLHASIDHPLLGTLSFATSFAADAFVVWANDRTFSIEPYLTLQLAPGESRTWHVTYGFGASSGTSSPSASSRTEPAR